MTSTRAWYSLIQYRPRLERAEGANVGLLVFAPERALLEIRMSETNTHIAKMFGRGSYDGARLDVAKRAIARRVREEAAAATTVEALRAVLRREGNQLQFTTPREIALRDPANEVERLFDDLVGSPHKAKPRGPRRIPEVAALARRLREDNVPIEVGVDVEIALLGENLHADLVYQNGARHFVKSQWFHDGAIHAAQKIGSQGLILRAEAPPGEEVKVIVVAQFDEDTHGGDVRRILAHHQVDVVDVRDLSTLEQRIRREAH